MSKVKDTLPKLREWGFDFRGGRIVSPLGKILSARISNSGYYLSTVCCPDGSKVTVPLAQVAAYEKFGEIALDGNLQVRHLNGDSLDNSFTNIAMGTKSQNERDKPADVRSAAARKARQSQGYTPTNAKLTPTQVNLIKNRLHEGDAVLANEFGVSRGTIYNIRNGRTYINVK